MKAEQVVEYLWGKGPQKFLLAPNDEQPIYIAEPSDEAADAATHGTLLKALQARKHIGVDVIMHAGFVEVNQARGQLVQLAVQRPVDMSQLPTVYFKPLFERRTFRIFNSTGDITKE